MCKDPPCNPECPQQALALTMPEVPPMAVTTKHPPTHPPHTSIVSPGVVLAECGNLFGDRETKGWADQICLPCCPAAHVTRSHTIRVRLSQVQSSGSPPSVLQAFHNSREGRKSQFQTKAQLTMSSRMTCHSGRNARFPGNRAPQRTWDRCAHGPTRPTITGTERQVTGRKTAGSPRGKGMRVRSWHNERPRISRCFERHTRTCVHMLRQLKIHI